jgi:hypothetical protein
VKGRERRFIIEHRRTEERDKVSTSPIFWVRHSFSFKYTKGNYPDHRCGLVVRGGQRCDLVDYHPSRARWDLIIVTSSLPVG